MVDEAKMRLQSLVAFFRSGLLYFKPVATLQFTWNPFSELLHLLSDAEKERVGGERLPFADAEAGIGAFNIKQAANFASEIDTADESQKKMSIRPYAIETCLGYWVPSALESTVQKLLRDVSTKKRARLEQLKAALEKIGVSTLRKRYDEYLKGARQRFDAARISLKKFTSDVRSNPFDSHPSFGGYLDRLLDALNREEMVERLAQPFVRGSMPEIWDDPVAMGEFGDSFFEYLAFVSAKPGKQNRVPARLLHRSRVGPGATPQGIRVALEKVLRVHGWTDKDWNGKG